MAGQDKRMLLPPPVGNNEHGAKVAREQTLVLVVKDETQQALVPLVLEPAQIDVRVNMMLLHCKACLSPLKPPIFKCKYGHVGCCYCRSRHGAEIRCSELDAFISAAKVPCFYARFGCDSYIAKAHERACAEPTCGFLGSPPALLEHSATDHSRPIFAVRYGLPWNLSLPLSQRWHVILGQEDQSVFLVTLGDLGVEAIAVSMVCIRTDVVAAAAGAPQFWCKLSVEHPGGDKYKVVSEAWAVSSSTVFGGASTVARQEMFLAVPHELIFGEMLAINVRIDQVHSVDASTTTTTF